jgi:S-DNA-T family DNA segregation ATPase FtsK/SpoIIIE
MYQDAVRVVLELGKASTSTLQRRLRLGYGRAARILDMMQRDGIIGPPDGPRPREVLKRPDWLAEIEEQRR